MSQDQGTGDNYSSKLCDPGRKVEFFALRNQFHIFHHKHAETTGRESRPIRAPTARPRLISVPGGRDMKWTLKCGREPEKSLTER
jgi:hypothetical protein